MSQAIHLNIPGCGPSDGSCFLCSGVTGRAVSVSPCSSQSDHKKVSLVKSVSLKCASRSMSSVCNASSGIYRRNPDFSKQNKHGFSHSRNRQFEERDGSDNLQDSELFSSKNGSTLSPPGTSKYHATATPGPKEKDIVELFRKVQAQLRETAAIKEEKKNEDPKGPREKNETIDSLLKLLRKHSVQKGKRINSTGSSRDFTLDQPQANGSFSTEKTSTFFGSNNTVNNKVQEIKPLSVRPMSSFRRRSPVPQIKKLPVYSDEEAINSTSPTNLEGKQKETGPELRGEHEPDLKFKVEPELEPEPVLESEAELCPIFPNEDMVDEMSGDETSDRDEGSSDDADEQNTSEHTGLSGMKLPDLKALAKSRGVKGFSKLKKRELLKLLTVGSI